MPHYKEGLKKHDQKKILWNCLNVVKFYQIRCVAIIRVAIDWMKTFPGWKLSEWEIFGWEFSGWEFPWVGIVQVGLILGGDFLWWKFYGWELSGGNHPGDNFRGGSFHVTKNITDETHFFDSDYYKNYLDPF